MYREWKRNRELVARATCRIQELDECRESFPGWLECVITGRVETSPVNFPHGIVQEVD